MKWRSIALEKAGKPHGQDKEITDAYRRLFGHNNDNAQIVLADLADFCGFYKIEPSGSDMSAYQAGHVNGLRSAFGRIFYFLGLNEDDLKALEEAAREESRARSTEE